MQITAHWPETPRPKAKKACKDDVPKTEVMVDRKRKVEWGKQDQQKKPLMEKEVKSEPIEGRRKLGKNVQLSRKEWKFEDYGSGNW